MVDVNQLGLSKLESQYGLPSGLLTAVMRAESGGNPSAVSPAGAQGLFQFMPDTAKAYGVDPFDPQSSAIGAARMYGDLNKKYSGDLPSMLAAYNWGSGNLAKFGMENAPKETRDYIAKVTAALPKQYADSGQIMTDASVDDLTPEQAAAELAAMGLDPEGNPLQTDTAEDLTPEQAIAELQAMGLDAEGKPLVAPVQEKPSMLADVGKSIVGGLQRGAVAAPMILPNMINQAAAGPQMLYRGIRDTVQGNETDNSPLWQPFYSSEDVLQALPEKLRPHNPETIAGVGADLVGQLVGGVAGTKATQAVGNKAIAGTKTAIKGAKARTPEELEQAAQKIADRSAAAYKEMRDSGATVGKRSVAKITNRIEKDISTDGKLNAELHKKTLSVMSDFKDAARKGEMGVDELEQWRRLFRKVVDDTITTRGSPSDDGNKAQKAVDAIDDIVNNLRGKDMSNGGEKAVKALNKGRSEWARMRRFEEISNIVTKADGDPNRLKNLLKSFADNKKKTRGFSKEELAVLKDAARNSTTEGILKMLGRFGIDIGGSRAAGITASPVIGSVASGVVAGTPGAIAAPVVGTGARQLQKFLGRGKVENLLGMIEGGAAPAPSAQSTPLELLGLSTTPVAGLLDYQGRTKLLEYGKSLEKFQ